MPPEILHASPKNARSEGGPRADRLRVAGLRNSIIGPVDLALDAQPVAITGPSGAGKSLLLRMIADLDPHEGDAWLDGQRQADIPAPEWRRQVIYCAAETGWWAGDVAAHFPPATRAEAAAEAASLSLPPDILNAPVQRLSSGERARVALLRALVRHPKLLLLDEPTGALDHDTTLRVEAVLRARMEAGLAILLVTHEPAQVERLGARHLRLHAGTLSAA